MSLFLNIEKSENKIISRCPARVGLLGNPSDGFNGKTLSFALANYYAEVIIQFNENINYFEIIPNNNSDKLKFNNINEYYDYTLINVNILFFIFFYIFSI